MTGLIGLSVNSDHIKRLYLEFKGIIFDGAVIVELQTFQ
jgi:hypothetical protein